MRLTKKMSLVLWAGVFGLVAGVGCSGPKGKAQSRLQAYVLAEGIGSKKAMKKHLVEADQKVLQKEIDEREKKGGAMPEELKTVAEDAIGHQFKVKVKEAKVDGEKMDVTAEVQRPNEDEMKKAMMGEVFKVMKDKKDASEEEKEKALVKAVKKVFNEKEFSTDKTTENFTLKKEGGKWLVFKNLKAKNELEAKIDEAGKLIRDSKFEEATKRAEELGKKVEENGFSDLESDIERLKVNILQSEARKLSRDKKFGEAVKNYEKIAEIGPSGPFAMKKEEIDKKIKELKAKKKKAEAAEAYKEKIELNGVKVKDLYGNHRIVGEVKNGGDKKVGKLELGIKFFDKDGNEVHSDSKTVVYAFGKESKAFKPGHSKKFRDYASDAPDAWDKESIKVNVATVEFFEKK